MDVPVPHLSVLGVTKCFGSVVAVDSVTLEIAKGQRISLLGPSGCGKTTLLGLIAGFSSLDAGRIEINGKDLERVPSHRRNLGIVFQNYALFPHLTVVDNIRFGLRMRSVPRAEIQARIRDALALVQLQNLGDRYPGQISGGQQQRVAIARALVVRPDILLLDEPLSNLDAKLRQEMRTDLLDILERLKITTVLVTHDQSEALALSDRVVLLNSGRVEQIGTPRDVYERPITAFAAKFLGESNILRGKVIEADADKTVCEIPGGFRVHARPLPGAVRNDDVELILRLENLALSTGTNAGAINSFDVNLEHAVFLGSEVRYVLRLGPNRLIAVDKNRAGTSRAVGGLPLRVCWASSDMFVTNPVHGIVAADSASTVSIADARQGATKLAPPATYRA